MTDQRHDKTEIKEENSNSRRRFIKKASAGAALTAIPAKSVWANGNGLIDSIQASAHASGWSQQEIMLLSHGWWKNQGAAYSQDVMFCVPTIDKEAAFPFIDIFGYGYPRFNVHPDDAPLDSPEDRIQYDKNGNSPRYKKLKELTLYDVVAGENVFDEVYFQISAMYLNAKHHNEMGLFFPVWQNGRPFSSLEEYAEWLYNNAQNEPGFGAALADLIENNHA